MTPASNHRTLADMYTTSTPAPKRAPYFGRWPVVTIRTEYGTHTIEFAWSTLDVWPELLALEGRAA